MGQNGARTLLIGLPAIPSPSFRNRHAASSVPMQRQWRQPMRSFVCGFQQESLGPKLANGAPIGGNVAFILNNEIRCPLLRIFDAVSFVDIGNVFQQVSDFRLRDLRLPAAWSAHPRNPFVVLRLITDLNSTAGREKRSA